MQCRNELYINGRWVAPRGGTIPVINPADESILCQAPCASAEDINDAVKAARDAFENGPWRATNGTQRAAYLRKIAELVKGRKEQLCVQETYNTGKPYPEAEWDIDDVAACFEYYADQAVELDKKQYSPIPTGDESFTTSLRFEPAGVAAAIVPWNYPMLMATWKVAPALASGCCIVLKPSEVSPVTALELAAICHEAGIPAGVINVCSGGREAGACLSEHPDVDKVSFTGSVPTGQRVMQSSIKNIRNITLELGGKSPIIVYDDVDIDFAVEWVMFGCFWTNGQICSATSRLLIHDTIAEKFIARLVEETEKIEIVTPMLEANLKKTGTLGPVVSKMQYDKVMGMIQKGVDAGGQLLTGGKRPAQFQKGYFVEPTIFRVKADNPVWKEEIFGPVLSVMSFSTEEEALRLANDTCFGLGSAVISKSEERCRRVVEGIRAGIVWVNCSQPCFCNAPWGGMKQSGLGRELGTYGMDSFLEVKQVTTNLSTSQWAWYFKEPSAKM